MGVTFVTLWRVQRIGQFAVRWVPCGNAHFCMKTRRFRATFITLHFRIPFWNIWQESFQPRKTHDIYKGWLKKWHGTVVLRFGCPTSEGKRENGWKTLKSWTQKVNATIDWRRILEWYSFCFPRTGRSIEKIKEKNGWLLAEKGGLTNDRFVCSDHLARGLVYLA